jgi:uncharacterized protein (TIGR02246 family)
MIRRFACPVLVLAAVAATASPAPSSTTSSAADAAAIRAVIDAYRNAWLRGDARGVMETLTPDAVLLPAHGAPPVAGGAAIERYWWPPASPPATITRLDVTIENVEVVGGLASVYGHDDVEWTQVEGGVVKAHGHPGTYLNVMRKRPDGSWRISRHMWDDGASR